MGANDETEILRRAFALGLTLLYVCHRKRREKFSWAAVGVVAAPDVNSIAIGLASGMAAILIAVVSAHITHILAPNLVSPLHVRFNPWDSSFPLFLPALILTAATEELAFRGYQLRMLQQSLFPWAAVLVNAAFFTAIHFSLVGSIHLFPIAVVYVIARTHSRSLWAPCIAHAIFNLFCFLCALQ